MNEELYVKLLNACAVFAVREKYDTMTREQMSLIAEKKRVKMNLLYEVEESQGRKLEKATEIYEQNTKEDIDPTIMKANKEIERLGREEKKLWQQNRQYLEFLPEAYRTAIAVTFMMSAVKNCRADTLKEVINLYEATVTQWKLEKVLSDAVKMRKKHYEYMSAAVQEIEQNQQELHRELQEIKYKQSAYDRYNY